MRVERTRFGALCVSAAAAAALLAACSGGTSSDGAGTGTGPSGDDGGGAAASHGDGGAGAPDAHGWDGGSTSTGQDGGSGSKGDAGSGSDGGGGDGGSGSSSDGGGGGGDAGAPDGAAGGDAGGTTDPFDPQSCPGQPLTEAQSVAFFQQGATQATIGSYTIQMRQRSCNAVTGCTAWGAPTTSIGIALGGGTMSLSGTIFLNVQGTSVALSLQDATEEKPWSMGATCSNVDGTPQKCGGYSYDMGDQWGGSGGLYPTMVGLTDVNSANVLLTGVLTQQCLRLAYSALDKATGDEVQQYVLYAPVAPGGPPPPDPCPGGGTQMACGSQASGQTTCCQNGLTTCPQSGCDCWAACQ